MALHKAIADAKKEHPKLTERDFLIAASELKLYLTEHVQAGLWNMDEKTFRGKWKAGVEAFASLKDKKVKFDPDDFPVDQIFLLTVDGVNFTIREQRLDPGPKWYDHKSHSAGVAYEVAVDIRRSRLLWVNGPRPASISESVTFHGGKKSDKLKDPGALYNQIPEGKRAIADSALKSSDKVTTSRPGHSKETKEFIKRAKARMESTFTRFKSFGILRQRFRHNVEFHEAVVHAIAVLVSYDWENGHPLFDV